MRQNRRGRTAQGRQHMRMPTMPTEQHQHNLSVFVLKETQPGEPIKLPTYDEIQTHQVKTFNIKNIDIFRRKFFYIFISK